MEQVILDENGYATTDGQITVYNYDGETREYMTSSVEYLVAGFGIPAHSSTDAPGEHKDGFAICRNADSTGWEYVADHRGETVYNTTTGKPVTVSHLGEYPKGTTTSAPSTPYDKWDGQKWVTDAEAQHADAVNRAENERQQLLKHADSVMLDWRTELMLGEISDNNRAKLSAWLAYKNEVKAVDVTTDPERVNWPQPPED